MRNRSTPCRGSCPLRPDGQGQLQLSMWRSMERFQSIRTRCSAKCWMARIERDLDPTALRRPAQTKRNGQAGRLTSLTGTARCGAACRVVWEGWQAQSCHPDPIRLCLFDVAYHGFFWLGMTPESKSDSRSKIFNASLYSASVLNSFCATRPALMVATMAGCCFLRSNK